MSNWNSLSLTDKAKYIQLGVLNGVTNLDDIRNAYNRYSEGGDLNDDIYYGGDIEPAVITPQSSALNQSRLLEGGNSNFMGAQDRTLKEQLGSTVGIHFPKWLQRILGINPATCINTLTSLYDSKVSSNEELVKNPDKYGYKEITQEELTPGDLIILNSPGNHPKHAVMFDSIATEDGATNDGFPIHAGDTLVNYSNGGIGNGSYYVRQPLTKFGPENEASGDKFSGRRNYIRYDYSLTGSKKRKKNKKK